MAYVGAESGSEKVLEDIHKGETRQQLIDGVKKIEASGMKASVTFISGLAGKAGWEEHAIESGKMISEMSPSYVALLTLIVDPSVPMAKDIESGKMELDRFVIYGIDSDEKEDLVEAVYERISSDEYYKKLLHKEKEELFQ